MRPFVVDGRSPSEQIGTAIRPSRPAARARASSVGFATPPGSIAVRALSAAIKASNASSERSQSWRWSSSRTSHGAASFDDKQLLDPGSPLISKRHPVYRTRVETCARSNKCAGDAGAWGSDEGALVVPKPARRGQPAGLDRAWPRTRIPAAARWRSSSTSSQPEQTLVLGPQSCALSRSSANLASSDGNQRCRLIGRWIFGLLGDVAQFAPSMRSVGHLSGPDPSWPGIPGLASSRWM